MNGLPDMQAQQTSMGNQFASETPQAGFPWRLMVFAIVFLAFFVFVYVGIKFGYESYLTSRKDALAAQTAKLSKDVNAADQAQFVNFYSQVSNLKKIFANHAFGSNVFKFLEGKVAAGVYFTNVMYSAASGRMDASGVAVTNGALEQQLAALDSAPEVSSAVLTDMKYDERGRVVFGVKVQFTNDALSQAL